MTEQTYTVIRQHWIERELGWGFRPDGDSLHLSIEDRDAFVKEYWDRMPSRVPEEYSSPECEPQEIEVNELTYHVLQKQRAGEFENDLSRYGIRMFRLYTNGRIVTEPPTWLCERMKEQGFRVEDFGKATPAVVDETKNLQYQSKVFTEGMARSLFSE